VKTKDRNENWEIFWEWREKDVEAAGARSEESEFQRSGITLGGFFSYSKRFAEE
jgi:hypothetical protein